MEQQTQWVRDIRELPPEDGWRRYEHDGPAREVLGGDHAQTQGHAGMPDARLPDPHPPRQMPPLPR